MVIRRVFAFTGGLAVAAAVVAGCGPSSTADSSSKFKGEQRLVANAIEDLQSAGERRQASRICNDLFAADLVRKIRAASGGKKTCATRLKKSLDDADQFELSVRRVTISGPRATAVVESAPDSSRDRRTDTVRLVKEGTPARWRIVAFAGQ